MLARTDSYSTGDVAVRIGRSSEWFREHRHRLHAEGFPLALPGGGHPRYPKAEVDAWVAAAKRAGWRP